MAAVINTVPAIKPIRADFMDFPFLYMSDAVHANADVDRTFMVNPIMPVSLTVIISINETITDTTNDHIGPYMRPHIVIITSFGSYLRKRTTGILIVTMAIYAKAQNTPIAVMVLVSILFVFVFLICLPLL